MWKGIIVSGFCSLYMHTMLYAQGPVNAAAALQRVPAEFSLCDGPSWNGKTLFVPDVKAGILYECNLVTGTLNKIVEGSRISGTCFRHGRLYCSDNGNARIAVLDGRELTTLAILDAAEKPENRPNDLVVDHAGGVYVTITKANQVFYVNRNGMVSVAVDGLPGPNGLTLSPDEKILYVSSYGPKEIWAFDVIDQGKTANGHVFAAMDDGKDLGADGMTIDSDGNVYCAGAKEVWIWNPKGTLLNRLQTPTRPINCTFGDGDLKTLYITCFGGLYSQGMTVPGLSPLRDH